MLTGQRLTGFRRMACLALGKRSICSELSNKNSEYRWMPAESENSDLDEPVLGFSGVE
jgi:hypothetical protein